MFRVNTFLNTSGLEGQGYIGLLPVAIRLRLEALAGVLRDFQGLLGMAFLPCVIVTGLGESHSGRLNPMWLP